MYSIIILIGLLVGLEIPFLTRIIEENDSNIRVNLANIFTFDYIGGLVGSLAFPLLLFPKLGFITTAFLVGSINIMAALLIIFKYKEYIKNYKIIRMIACIIFAVVFCFLLMGQYITDKVEGGLYRDDIIYSEQTMYQKIVVTKHKDDLRLFLDGNEQFSSADEYRYHELLVHEDSLRNEKVKVRNEDAYLYVSENKELFDVIIIDLPDPNTESLNKLYTNVFYNYVRVNLKPTGVMVCQSTSPYYAKNSFWCIHKTIAAQFANVIPYHVQVPSFEEWGFNMAFPGEVPDRGRLLADTRYLTENNLDSHFVFGADETVDLDKIDVNEMFRPELISYYNNDVENW